MYIPTWILVIGIIVAIYFFIVKRSKKSNENSSISSQEKTPTVDDFDGDQKDMLKHLSDYRKRSGKQMPTYEEMLEMNKDELQTWALYRVQKENRKELLVEMITYEEKTGSFRKDASFRKTAGKEILEGEQAAMNVFDREKSAEMIEILDELGSIPINDDGGKDLVMEVIIAKIASDHAGLGKNVEKKRNEQVI